jgi:hypothetical protein
MRKLFLAIFIVFGIALVASAKEPETIDQLKARAATAEQNKQPELYSKLAKEQLEAANEVYGSNAEQARKLIDDTADSAEKASKASLASGKRQKKTEIDLRQLAKRMDDIGRSWAFDDRAPVKAAMDRVESARSKILDRMFEK